MRIILLTILFTGSYYFLTKEDKVITPEIDQIKLKMGAPERDHVERILTIPKQKEVKIEAEVAETPVEENDRSFVSSSEEGDLEHVEEVQLTDLEAGWNNELKDMLLRLEPAEGEEIHRSYIAEQEAYQAELDALMNEKQQKTTDEAIQEVEQLISQLDHKHQDRLKEIFGAHYEAVRDGYESYMDSATPEE